MKRLRLPFVSRSLRRDLLASKGAASLSALLVCGLGAACGLKESPQAPPATRTAAITYGELDTKHDAVIAIIHKVGGQVMACGATIVATKGRSAYALTAAHCLAKTTTSGSLILPPEAASKDSLSVVFGDNWFVPDPEIKIILDLAIHPGFTGTSHENDFGMVRFAIPGTTVSTIPPMTPADDDLAVGTKLDMVGFGMTEDRQKNTLRRHIVKP
ncbi:MAG: trypsin-like serine protease, partial [Deltaproteobacteria bacterium]|nr:trypsin-like serine protease [Deltaproteobacteria bacterium]